MKRLVAHAALVAGLALGGLSMASPGYAGPAAPRTDGLLDLLTPPQRPAKATVWSSDGVLEEGRQRHAFRYRVQTAEAWSLELFLLDPNGRQISFSNQQSGADQPNGRDVFRFWSQGTRPGKFTIKAKLTWGDYDQAERWLEPRTFRLRRR
ncbi:MAG: hypothetical protein M3237_22565 [Actinomycetota bacterium]|nr:hypothetical protein [Actinomycetota bacterium]